MEKLRIPDTERLVFICGDVDYDALFKDVMYSSVVKKELQAIFDLPDEERRAAVQENIRILEADIQFITKHVAPKDADPNIHVAIYAESKDGEPVGRVILNNLTTEHPTIDVRVLPEKQHQGFGYEMLAAIADAAFDQYAMDHLEYDVLCSNVPSRSLIRKLKGEMTYSDGAGEMYVLYPSCVEKRR